MKYRLRNIASLYIEGFREMTVGKTLWLIILLKLIIMFGILKVFFFPNFLNTKADTDEKKSEYVGSQLSDPATR